jgi:hypothetical protein
MIYNARFLGMPYPLFFFGDAEDERDPEPLIPSFSGGCPGGTSW